MIRKNDCTLLGTIAKPHGTRGSVVMLFKDLKVEDIRERDPLFVEIDGLLVPFFVEQFQGKSPKAGILKFLEVENITQVKKLLGCFVYVSNKQDKPTVIPESEPMQIAGYRVNDIHLGFVGTAGGIANITNNPLLRVIRDKKEILVPLHPDIIIEVDDVKKVIVTDAPEGLFEL